MRSIAVLAVYAALVTAQDLNASALEAADPVPTPDIPVVYSYSADYSIPSATITANVVDYNPTAAAESVSSDVIASATQDGVESSATSTTTATSAGSLDKRSTTGSCAALAAAGSTYTSTQNIRYTVQCGYDYPGYDLATASVSSFSACYAQCDAYPGCTSFAYVPGTCYLKRLGAVAKPNSGVSAGALVNMPTTNPSLCVAQPTGISHISKPDTASSFQADSYYANAASQAATPSGYTQAFTGLNASNNALGYLGYSLLSTYDTVTCASRCNAVTGCSAINIYFERDPSVDPNDSSCSNPPSYTQIKCVYWGGPVTTSNALNVGQWRNKFQVVMAGSNGYVSNSVETPNGYTAPAYLGNAVIRSPDADCAVYNFALQSYVWTTGPFDIQLCAAACNAYNAQSPTQTCKFFNTFVAFANGATAGQYCQLYSQSFNSTYATNTASIINGIKYTYAYSFSSSNATNPGGPLLSCNVAYPLAVIVSEGLQPYCSTLLHYPSPPTVTVTATTLVTAVSTETDIATITSTVISTSAPFAKRAVMTPYQLYPFPGVFITSACMLLVTSATTTATVTGATITSAAATSVTTTSTTVTATTSTVAAPTGMTILSAYYGDQDVTDTATYALPLNDQILYVDCVALQNTFGIDPMPGTTKTFAMLYDWQGETRAFSCYDYQDVYTLDATQYGNGGPVGAHRSPPGAPLQIVTALWSWEMITSEIVYRSMYLAAHNNDQVVFTSDNFHIDTDPLPGATKVATIWYYVNGQLRTMVGWEGDSGLFDLS